LSGEGDIPANGEVRVAKPAKQEFEHEVEETQAPKGDEEGEPDGEDDDEPDEDEYVLPAIERGPNIRKADQQPLDLLSRQYGITR
jgi:hypothetical protein